MKKDKVYKKIREIAAENDCDEKFLNAFDACYTFMYESIEDLPVMKQILITVRAMCLGTKAATVQIERMAAYHLNPKRLY